jgi:hypothetical protein
MTCRTVVFNMDTVIIKGTKFGAALEFTDPHRAADKKEIEEFSITFRAEKFCGLGAGQYFCQWAVPSKIV